MYSSFWLQYYAILIWYFEIYCRFPQILQSNILQLLCPIAIINPFKIKISELVSPIITLLSCQPSLTNPSCSVSPTTPLAIGTLLLERNSILDIFYSNRFSLTVLLYISTGFGPDFINLFFVYFKAFGLLASWSSYYHMISILLWSPTPVFKWLQPYLT